VTRSTLVALLAALLPVFADAHAQTATINGFVTDTANGESVPFATVALADRSVGTLGNTNGYYVLKGVMAGNQVVVASHVGYEERMDTVLVQLGEEVRLDIRLQQQVIAVDEQTVVAERLREETAVQPSLLVLLPRQLQRMPAVAEADLLRSLQLLPGIQSASDISSGLYVRGGGPDQTRILLDQIPLYNPSHAFGFFSTFSPDTIKDVTLYKGAYPAMYGGNLGAILDVSNLEGNREHFAARGGVNLISGRLLLEGPVGSGSWMVSSRRTWLDPVLAAVRSSGTDVPDYYFYDFNGKINQRRGDDALLISTYIGQDELDFDLEEDTFFTIRWGNRAITGQWTHLFSSSLFARFMAAGSAYESVTKATIFDTPILVANRISDITLKGHLDYYATSTHRLSGGVELTQYDFDFREVFNDQDQLDREESPRLVSAYLQDDWQVDPLTRLRLGLRGSYFSEGRRFNLMPRASASRALSQRVRLKLSGGAYRQFLQLVTTEGFSGGDYWVPLDKTVKPGRSRQSVAGIEWEASRCYQLSIEAYFTDLDDLVVLDGNVSADSRDTASDEIFKSQGSGYASGIELFLQRRTGALTGWLGYTLGKTRRTFSELNGGRSFSPKFDRRHDVSFVASYRRGRWTFGSNFVYATGQAFTPAAARYSLREPATGQVESYVLPADRNSARLLPYHRLDASARREIGLFGSDAEIYLQIFNLYSRRNEWFVQYDTESPETDARVIKQLPIVPTFGIDFEF